MFSERAARSQTPRRWWIYKSKSHPEVWTIEFPYWGSGDGFTGFALTFEDAVKKCEAERFEQFKREFPIGEVLNVPRRSN